MLFTKPKCLQLNIKLKVKNPNSVNCYFNYYWSNYIYPLTQVQLAGVLSLVQENEADKRNSTQFIQIKLQHQLISFTSAAKSIM